ncbi:hypothetical protein LSH36_1337g00013 [Paralvinella palmiformis]|uniref:Uncharacterized protein n=1 Tax=Paralvinella palmiformis TaxID=53620 RepID=A0AAD9ITV1_9ANNE|nr:hypothetical protein LSH36_1337g00013 [Paralvinella palmiformis]
MMRDTNLILNWSSYLIHCLVLVMLIFSFCMPYWYISELSVDGGEIAGLWARCHVGGSCRPVHDTLDPMSVKLKPVQALMTLSLILCLVTFAVYSVWLWKGEGCATPWQKDNLLRLQLSRSRKPTEEESIKFGRLKWLAFTLAIISGKYRF